ncbi:MAG: sugar transferase [Chloroflexi bacterium]|nr:sugar transferase [Chloroflexota bacterium]
MAPAAAPLEQGRARRQSGLLRLALLGVDLAALVAAVVMVGPIREAFQGLFPLPPDWDTRHVAASLITVPVMLVVFWLQGRYDLENSLVGPREYGQIVHAVGAGVILAMALSFFTGDRPLVSRSWLVLTWVLTILFVSLARFLARRAVHWLHRCGVLHTRVIVVGASALGVALAEQFRAARSEGIDVVGFIDEYLPLGQRIEGVPVVGRPIDLIGGLDPNLADEYILVPQALPHQRLEEISRHVTSRGGPVVRMAVSSTDLLTHGFVVAERSNIPLLTLRRARLNGMDWLLKRAVDIGLATIALFVLAPIAAAKILRRGVTGRHSLWSRQMVSTTGGSVTVLRLLSPDVATWPPLRGAPALLAVIGGSLSLVGPRPRLWEPGGLASAPVPLTAIAPGLTGPWRLAGPDTTLEEQDLADLTYVRNYSIWEDLRILWRTARCLLHAGSVDKGLGRWRTEATWHSTGDAWYTPIDGRIPLTMPGAPQVGSARTHTTETRWGARSR